MAYENNDKLTINTNGVTFFGTDDTMLKMGFYDTCMTIGFWSGVRDSATNKLSFPKEARISAMLTPATSMGLETVLNTRFLPKMSEGKAYKGGVFTNKAKTSVIDIEIGEDGKARLYYYREIDSDRHPKFTNIFEFPKEVIIEDYNATSGEFNITEVNSYLYLFIKAVVAFNDTCNAANAHAERLANAYSNKSITTYLTKIAAKLGIQTDSYQKSSGGFDNSFENNDAVNAKVEIADSIESLMG